MLEADFLNNYLFIYYFVEGGRAEGERESPADSPLSAEPEVGFCIMTLTRVGT